MRPNSKSAYFSRQNVTKFVHPILSLDSPPTVFIPTHDGIQGYSPSGYGGHSIVPVNTDIKSVDFYVAQNTTAVLWLDGRKNTINLAAREG